MSIIYAVAELGEGPGDPPPTLLFWVKNEEIQMREKLAEQTKQNCSPHPCHEHANVTDLAKSS